jgi:hypothetical protein
LEKDNQGVEAARAALAHALIKDALQGISERIGKSEQRRLSNPGGVYLLFQCHVYARHMKAIETMFSRVFF